MSFPNSIWNWSSREDLAVLASFFQTEFCEFRANPLQEALLDYDRTTQIEYVLFVSNADEYGRFEKNVDDAFAEK